MSWNCACKPPRKLHDEDSCDICGMALDIPDKSFVKEEIIETLHEISLLVSKVKRLIDKGDLDED